ncbi:type 1 fimbrial protein [Escherichia coli O157:H7]|nr:putative minor fimbrial subunit [Escherichia coli O157:H7 str. EC4115]AJA27209.1 Minor fimbrial subunit StfG [Escherichia coli O157:H7 str. SS52]AMG77320.1 fimbrial protein [Escherichia coli O157:H7]API04925.1 fimbrial protein [Escherichia coli]ASE49345.1 type 1 fimbrial protein [Escherichia coli O157]EDU35170.1 putative minor fimbrial subunit [Escherichia coli O157:H7 str. EC4196]EDU55432.1 putative minor fimbrial subunit [Escherichia coli O157:H7 str. EC4113]EDU71137.1 putative minor fi
MKNNRAWALISGLILFSGTAPAADNLHFTGNLLGKSCTPVINIPLPAIPLSVTLKWK